jgi:hypothetical protein
MWLTAAHAIKTSQQLPAIDNMAIKVSTFHLGSGANL